jgi:hypothetical protein
MKGVRLVSLACAAVILGIIARDAAACHVVKVALRQPGERGAAVYEYTVDGAVREAAALQEAPAAEVRKRALTPEEVSAIVGAAQQFPVPGGTPAAAPPGNTVSVDIIWSTGQKTNLVWPATGDHPDPRSQALLQLLLKARPAGP